MLVLKHVFGHQPEQSGEASMLPTIVFPSRALKTFVNSLGLGLTKPQRRHLEEVVEGLLMTDGRKTLAAVTRQLVTERDIYAVADFFRASPWTADTLRGALRARMLADLCAQAATLPAARRIVVVSLDDSTCHKPRSSRHFEPVDWHGDYTEHTAGIGPQGQRYAHGLPVLTCRVHVNGRAYTVDWRPYMRARTIRRLNRQRSHQQRLPFRSKTSLAREVLLALAPLLPPDCRIYIVFDSWYASAKLLRFCLQHGWHVICDLKANRTLNGRPLHTYAQLLRHQRYDHSIVRATDGDQTYYTRTLCGHLKRLASPVIVIQSRRHPRDHHPKYLLCTDRRLTPQEILTFYAQRWGCEVDYFYLKTRLGLEDFRLRSVEGITKYIAVVFLTLAFLQRQQVRGNHRTLSEALATHREAHQRQLLKAVVCRTLQHRSPEPVFKRFLREVA
jgi:hypothetical protein